MSPGYALGVPGAARAAATALLQDPRENIYTRLGEEVRLLSEISSLHKYFDVS
jgi:hypothetical protein